MRELLHTSHFHVVEDAIARILTGQPRTVEAQTGTPPGDDLARKSAMEAEHAT